MTGKITNLARSASSTALFSEVEGLEPRRLYAAADYFQIQVKDAATNKGVPQADLVDDWGNRWTTDNNGFVAFNSVYFIGDNIADKFTVESYGYSLQGGGNSVSFVTKKGQSGVVTLVRNQIAERLYRATGQNKLDESVKLGQSTNGTNDPLDNNGHVSGQDTQSSVVYKGKLYQFWQDTGIDTDNQGGEEGASYRSTGATSSLPGSGGLDPSVGTNRTYFTDSNGRAKEMCPANNTDGSVNFGGSGLFWLGSPMVVKDSGGNDRLVASYAVIGGTDRAGKTHGFAVFNDAKGNFDYVSSYDPPNGVSVAGSTTGIATYGGQSYIVMPSAGGLMRVKATYADATNINNYETYTPLKANTNYSDPDFFGNTNVTASMVVKDTNGKPVWDWRKGTKPLSGNALNALIGNGILPRAGNPFNFENRDAAGDYKVFNSSSMAFNPYKNAWTMIGQDQYGSDVWYSQAASPTGPWSYAKDIATHARADRNYTFYNMAQQPAFTGNGQYLYFEGTYTMGYADGGLIADYFTANNLTGYSSEKFRDTINENFGTGAPANTSLPSDNFSIRYRGKIVMPNESGNYTFRVTSDDGFRLYVNNDSTPILDQWDGAAGTYTVNFFSYAGLTLPFKLEYREKYGGAAVKVELAKPSAPTAFGVVNSGNAFGTFKHDAPVYDDNYNQVEYRINLADSRFGNLAAARSAASSSSSSVPSATTRTAVARGPVTRSAVFYSATPAALKGSDVISELLAGEESDVT